jgi:hypothetical protein
MESLNSEEVRTVLDETTLQYAALLKRAEQSKELEDKRRFKNFEEGRVSKEETGHALKVLQQLRQNLDDLRSVFPLVKVFSCSFLKDMHWAKIKLLTNTNEAVSISKMVLSTIRSLQIEDKTDAIEVVY